MPIAYALNAAAAAIEKGYGPDHILMSYQDIYIVLNELLEKKAATTPNPHQSRRSGS